MKKFIIILCVFCLSTLRLNGQSFEVNRIYGAIPCTVSYEILDTFYNLLYSETVTNPPGPIIPAPPACQYSGTAKPKYIKFDVSGSGNVTVPLDGTTGSIFLTCLTAPNLHYFYGFMYQQPPGSSCYYRIDIQL